MQINWFKVKRYAGLFLTALIPFVLFMVFIFTGWGLFWATVGWLVGVVLAVLLYRKVIVRHPLIDYLEGSGIVVKTLDSTGIIKSAIVDVNPPFIMNRKGEPIDYFDRDFVWYETIPNKRKGSFMQRGVKIGEQTYTIFGIPEDEFNDARFVEENYIVMMWNAPTKTFLTKEVIGKFEKELLTNHLLLYLVEKVKELSNNIRDFARYVVEMTKPKKTGLLNKWWVWLLIGLAVVIIGYLAWQAYAGVATSVPDPAPAPQSGAIVSPR